MASGESIFFIFLTMYIFFPPRPTAEERVASGESNFYIFLLTIYVFLLPRLTAEEGVASGDSIFFFLLTTHVFFFTLVLCRGRRGVRASAQFRNGHKRGGFKGA